MSSTRKPRKPEYHYRVTQGELTDQINGLLGRIQASHTKPDMESKLEFLLAPELLEVEDDGLPLVATPALPSAPPSPSREVDRNRLFSKMQAFEVEEPSKEHQKHPDCRIS
jgi:hypothetical protein